MRYKNKKQHRLKRYDYSSNGYYYVTICTNNKNNFNGEVVDGKMKLSGIGEIVRDFWLKIPDCYNNVILDEWIIMPNHIHGIIVIQNIMYGSDDSNGKSGDDSDSKGMIIIKVGTRRGACPLDYSLCAIILFHPLLIITKVM